MKNRISTILVVSVFLSAAFVIAPIRAGAAEPKDLTSQVMSGSSQNSFSGSVQKEIEVTNAEKKDKELQIKLSERLSAYFATAQSPYGKELNGKPLQGGYRGLFGFHIPLQ